MTKGLKRLYEMAEKAEEAVWGTHPNNPDFLEKWADAHALKYAAWVVEAAIDLRDALRGDQCSPSPDDAREMLDEHLRLFEWDHPSADDRDDNEASE